MDLGIDKTKLLQYKAALIKLLGEPAKMRLALVGVLTGLAIVAIYMPLSDQIDQNQRLLAAEKKRFDVIKDVESLRREVALCRPRIGQKSDTNEWVNYLLGGMRQARVKLRDMGLKEPQRIGPYKAISLSVEVQGEYGQLKKFVEWLDQSERLLRVDTVRIERLPNGVVMKLYVLGLVKKDA